MAAVTEKPASGDAAVLAERQDDSSNRLSTSGSVTDRANLLGATAEEFIEAEEYGRTIDLDEAKRVSCFIALTSRI
jgi:hypothetical protein